MISEIWQKVWVKWIVLILAFFVHLRTCLFVVGYFILDRNLVFSNGSGSLLTLMSLHVDGKALYTGERELYKNTISVDLGRIRYPIISPLLVEVTLKKPSGATTSLTCHLIDKEGSRCSSYKASLHADRLSCWCDIYSGFYEEY
jgi:hypothetical protein